MIEEIKILNKNFLENIRFFIQIPTTYLKTLKKKYEDLFDKNIFSFFSFKKNLNFREFDFILSRSGSGSINEILYYTNNAYFIPHLISRDQHQKFNLSYFLSHNMSLKNFLYQLKKKILVNFF